MRVKHDRKHHPSPVGGSQQSDPGLSTLLIGTHTTITYMRDLAKRVDPAPTTVAWTVTTTQKDTATARLDDRLERDNPPATLAHTIKINLPIEQAWICLPLVMSRQIRDVVNVLELAGITWRFLPTLADQLSGRLRPVLGPLSPHAPGNRKVLYPPTQSAPIPIRGQTASPVVLVSTNPAPWNLNVATLLDRHPHPLDEKQILDSVQGKTVLITGAGGSIGSELARILCRFNPSKLVLVERAENALFDIDRELAAAFPFVQRAAILHDVTDAPNTLAMIHRQAPDIIFHAAAHKHVPMMEGHPNQAVENNFYGTRSIADAAHSTGVGRFVMISTDKAVNPSSVMGATKRLAELYIRHLNARSRCVFSMVRFGNVLGSACSVLPIWSKQIAKGQPITVTDPQMHRYFMTIPEAAGLVLQSATFARGGEVFVLDMGEPIRVLDLAHRFVRSHGLEPDVDIPIRITGTRPGEKLYEELAYSGEDMIPTPHVSVKIWKSPTSETGRINQIINTFDRLRIQQNSRPWSEANPGSIVAALRWAIPEMIQSVAG